MEQPAPRLGLASITVAALLIIIAMAMIISWSADDWALLLPALIIGLGIYILMVGISKRSGDRLSRLDSGYLMFWGSLMFIIGALVVANDIYPGNLLLIIVVFILWLAAAILIFSIRPKAT